MTKHVKVLRVFEDDHLLCAKVRVVENGLSRDREVMWCGWEAIAALEYYNDCERARTLVEARRLLDQACDWCGEFDHVDGCVEERMGYFVDDGHGVHVPCKQQPDESWTPEAEGLDPLQFVRDYIVLIHGLMHRHLGGKDEEIEDREVRRWYVIEGKWHSYDKTQEDRDFDEGLREYHEMYHNDEEAGEGEPA